MDWDWGTIASCGSAVAAFIALFISLWQSRTSNRQSLFDRRLRIWITVEKLIQLYKGAAIHLKEDGEPQFAVDECYKWLTNTTFLQEITSAIAHIPSSEHQLKFHLKLDEMRTISAEASFAFRGKPGIAIAEFLDAYQALLFMMYRYQIMLNAMSTEASRFHWTLEKAAECLHEESLRSELYAAQDRLVLACESITDKKMLRKIHWQIRLDSTPADFLAVFR